jgi:hypothetical protein
MPRKKTEPMSEVLSEPHSDLVTALVDGVVTEVPVGMIIVDPPVLFDGDVESAMGALLMLRRGTLNKAFIPRLFPRMDGIFVWQGLSPRV